jgi:transposase-like protein
MLGVHISEERNMLAAEIFIRSLVSKYGKHTVFILMAEGGIQKHVMY